MTAQAGWYPDPSGDADKLRFWDGNHWTDDFMDASIVQQQQPFNASSEASYQPPSYGVKNPQQNAYQQAASQQPSRQQAQNTCSNSSQQPAGQQQYYQQPSYGVPASSMGVMNPDGTYVVDSTDSTLRLIASILYAIDIAFIVLSALPTLGLSLICLAWVLPMGIHCYKIYKGQKPNTIAFGVCTLLFCGAIAGVLLLLSKKDA